MLWLIVPISSAVEAFFSDQFASNAIDSARWQVGLPFTNPPASTVRMTNGMVELFRRGILEASSPFPTAFDLEGHFRFVGEADSLTIVFRSDLSVTNQAERRGVQAALQQGTARLFLVPDPFTTTPIAGTYTIGRDTNVAFRITDNGQTVSLFVQDFFQPIVTATITNRRGDRVAVYNLNGTTSRTRIDDLAAYPLQTTTFFDEAVVRTNRVRRSAITRVRFQSVFTNSPIFYTLDGSEPSFVSAEYTGAFSLSNSAIVRAVGYSRDYLMSSHSAPIEFEYLPVVRLTNETKGGGVVQLDPAGPYLSNQVVALNAQPAPGWQFVRWEGALAGTTVSNLLTLTNHVAVRAVFATTPAFTLVGNGQVDSVPAGPLQEYGAAVRLSATPAAGNYFVRWGNAVTGTISPVTLTVTNAAPAVTALFSPLAANQVSLAVRVEGAGAVTTTPQANVFTNGQTIALTARPDSGQIFLDWSGALSSRANPMNLLMDGSKLVQARFATAVRFDPTTLRLGSNGFQMSLTGGLRTGLDLQRSTNLADWSPVFALTNATGPIPFIDANATNNPRSFYRVVGP